MSYDIILLITENTSIISITLIITAYYCYYYYKYYYEYYHC